MENFRKEHDGMDATIADKRQIQPFYQEYKKIKSEMDTISKNLSLCIDECINYCAQNVSFISTSFRVRVSNSNHLVDLTLF